jgi:ABC-2 type transport system permease protein
MWLQLIFLRIRILYHELASILRGSKLRVSFLIIVWGIILSSIFLLSYILFSKAKETPAEFLIGYLICFFFFILFSLLIFSNLVNSFPTFYEKEEVGFLFSLPIRSQDIFIVKLIDTGILSSWASCILGLPIILGYAFSQNFSSLNFLILILAFILFLFLASLLASSIVLILASIFPLRRNITIILASLFILVLLIFLVFRLRGILSGEIPIFLSIGYFIQRLSFIQAWFLPNYWLFRIFSELKDKNIAEAVFYITPFVSTILLLLTGLYLFIAPKVYFPSWAKLNSILKRTSFKFSLKDLFFWLYEKALFFLPNYIRSYFVIELKSFWRDLTQYPQLGIFLGLCLIYVINLTQISPLPDILFSQQKLLLFTNIGAIWLLTAVGIARFLYPQFSIEAKKYWLLHTGGNILLPLVKVWKLKFISSFLLVVLCSELLVVGINLALKPPYFLFFFSVLITILVDFSMVSLALGIGIIYPNMKAKSYAAAVAGFGATLNALFSILYIFLIVSANIILLSLPLRLFNFFLLLLTIFLLSFWYTIIPLRLSFRRLKNINL